MATTNKMFTAKVAATISAETPPIFCKIFIIYLLFD
jgi:hypothetical protein